VTRLLVTGCGRSGTWWLAEALTAAGVPTDHEQAWTVASHGGNGWTSEVSWLAAPYTPQRGTHIVHLVRHPLDVVRSRVSTGVFEHRDRGHDDHGVLRAPLGPWGVYAHRWCPAMHTATSPETRAAWHWVQWNRLVVADELVRVEDVDADTVSRLARIVDPDAPGIEAVPARSHRTPGELPDIDWGDIAHVPHLARMAEGYGYDPR
jgi:hypothetical protein